MTSCAYCGGDGLPEREAVYLNGDPYHTQCFGRGLEAKLAPVRRAIAALRELEIRLGEDISPETAYQLGRDSAPALAKVQRRRRRRPTGVE